MRVLNKAVAQGYHTTFWILCFPLLTSGSPRQKTYIWHDRISQPLAWHSWHKTHLITLVEKWLPFPRSWSLNASPVYRPTSAQHGSERPLVAAEKPTCKVPILEGPWPHNVLSAGGQVCLTAQPPLPVPLCQQPVQLAVPSGACCEAQIGTPSYRTSVSTPHKCPAVGT